MIEEVSSVLWGVLAVFGIILILIVVPLFLLICCCCRRHQEALKKDFNSIARNHDLIEPEVQGTARRIRLRNPYPGEEEMDE